MKNILENTSFELAAATLSCIGDGVVSTDGKGKIVYINHTAEQILKKKNEECRGKLFNEEIRFIKADSGTIIKSPLEKVLKHDKVYYLEDNVAMQGQENQIHHMSVTFSPIKNLENEIIGAVIIIRDMTQVRNLENKYETEKTNLKVIFEQAPAAMIAVNEEFLITQANKAFLTLIYKKKEQVLGKTIGDSINCTENSKRGKGCIYGEACENCELRKTIDDSVENRGEAIDREIRLHLLISGQSQERWLRISVVPIIVEQEHHSIITIIDITEQKQREQTVIESRDFCHNILNQLPSLAWMMDKQFKCTYINTVWSEFVGKSMRDLAEESCEQIIHPEDIEKYIRIRDDAMNRERGFRTEVRIKRWDGKYTRCFVIATPFYGLNSEFSGYIGSYYDIEEQRGIEESLERYRKIIDGARDIIILVDQEGYIIDANQAAADAYAYSKEELLTMNISEIREEFVKETPEPDLDSGQFYETIHHRKDGTAFQVEVCTQIICVEGKQVVSNIIRDITQRKKTEKAILEHQEKYYLLFMNMESAYAYCHMVSDENGNQYDVKVVETNRAYEMLIGQSREEIIGTCFSDLFPNSKDILMKAIEKYAKKLVLGESIKLDDFYSYDYDKWLSVSVYSPIENEIVTMMSDVSERKQSELKLISTKEAAEEANKAKSEFLANMSHEIRTPINGMVGMIDLTLLTELNEEQKDNLESAKICANSLLKIINDILDFSKMEAGKLSVEQVSFDIKMLVEEVVKTYSFRVEEKGLELFYTMDSSIPQFLIGDPNRLKQIINNFLSNAVKFTKEGSVCLSVKKISKKEDEVELKFTVSDTGIGIAQENIGQLFQSFNQIEQTFTKRYGGTGLGLVISKNLVELMGGKIGVESEQGKGSTFYFVLKFAKSSSNEMKAIQISELSKVKRQLQILVAEDDIFNQKVIEKMLHERGHLVTLVKNGIEVLKAYDSKEFDIILMDIQMPEMNGLEAMQRIRKKEENGKRTPIVALTAYTLKGDRERFIMAGMDEYVPKPIDMNQLYYVIEYLAGRKVTKVSETPDAVILTEKGEVQFINSSGETAKKAKKIIHEVEEKIEILKTAIANDKMSVVEELAHLIKVACAEMDAIEMKDEAFRIELDARRGKWEDMTHNIKKLEEELKLLQNKFHL